jgi:hypothetical protein
MAKKRQKRRGSKSSHGQLRRLAKKVKREGLFSDSQIVYEPAGEIKMSEALITIMEPYLDDAESLNAYRNLASVATLAWNNTLMPAEAQIKPSELIDKLSMPAEDHDLIEELLTTLMERKKALFPDVQRFIVSHEVTGVGRGDWHLSVASTLLSGDDPT